MPVKMVAILVFVSLPLGLLAYHGPADFKYETDDALTVETWEDTCTADSFPYQAPGEIFDEREIYNSLPAHQQSIFSSIKDRSKPSILTPDISDKEDSRTSGLDNIFKNFPNLRDIIETKVKPQIQPGTESSMQLVPGCCDELVFATAPDTLVSIFKKKRIIVHFKKLVPPKYQLSYLGLCANEGGAYSHGGICRQRIRNVILLVYDENMKITFDIFARPVFCRCENK